MENGKRGRIICVKVFSRERGDNLDSGLIKRIHIEVAQLRNVSVGSRIRRPAWQQGCHLEDLA